MTFIGITGKEKDVFIRMLTSKINAQAPVLTRRVTKYYPPDTAAIKFYLGNRDGQRWPKNGDLEGEGRMLFFTHADVEKMLAEEKDTVLSRVPPPTKPKEAKNVKGEGKTKK